MSGRRLKLVLFFTRRTSLQTWRHVGILERELALYRRLQQAGVEVSFVTYGDARERSLADQVPGIQLLYNRWRLPRRVYERWLPWLHRDVLQQADVLKTNQTNGSLVALQSARRWRKPLVARCGYMWSEFERTQHGADSALARQAARVEQTVFSAASRIVVTTPAMAASVADRFPARQGQVTVIPNYVETDRFCPQPAARPDFDLVFVGRLVPQKNAASLLQAVRQTGARALMIGSGPQQSALRQQFADLGDRVLWQAQVPHEQLPQWLTRARMFVLPSRYEGHPKALLEAMACGLPVVATQAPGIDSLLVSGRTGLLCSGEAGGIARAISQLQQDARQRQALGTAAREFVLRHFSLDRVVQQELHLLQEVARNGSLEAKAA